MLWPRGGWGRALQYLRLRLSRLPGTPEEIGRGIFAGIFVTFSPFYGLHFVLAALLAKVMRGRILAAIIASFVGNPLTYFPIAIISLRTGYLLLGIPPEDRMHGDVFARLREAAHALWRNLKALVTPERTDWAQLSEFWNALFFPWMVGGLVPGVFLGLAGYFLSVPVIRAYQNRRAMRLKVRMKKLADQAGPGATGR
ncbi:MAG: DUF2062 domain-containing protein [Pseudomonadota bacterium]